LRWFRDLRTSTKLVAAFLAVGVIVVGVALVGYLSLRSLNAGTATLYADRLLPTEQLARFNDGQLAIGADLDRLLLIPGERADRERDIAALVTSADESLAQYEATYLVPEEVQGLAELKPAWADYQADIAHALALADSGDLAGALASVADGGPVSAAQAIVGRVVRDLIALQVRVGVDIKQQAERTFDQMTWAMIVAGLTGLVLAMGLAVLISRSISTPLSRITRAASDVAGGRLDDPALADIRSRDEIGMLARTFGFMTGRLREAQDALRKSEERYRRITESITDYVFRVDVAQGQPGIVTHGAGCAAVTGYTPEEFAAEPDLWLRMVAAEDRDAVVGQARKILAGGPGGPVEHRITRKDGTQRWVRTTLVPQFGPGGTLVAYDGLLQDITERRLLQQELLQAQKMESIGRLAGGVAHDFNNLLTVILGNAELARTELAADDPAREGIEEIVRAGERAASLTRQLLAFASKQIIAPVHLDLNAAVGSSGGMLRRLLGEDIEVITDLGPSLDAVVADPGQVQQLLVNLAVNARDAMPNGGTLVIKTANEVVTVDRPSAGADAPGRYVLLSVADTGVGMSEEVREHVFEPFFTTKGLGKGTGLGLATCRGIVRQVGGDIRVFSEPGHGTTFRILLPAADGPARVMPEAVSEDAASTGSETVLVVEDEPSVRRLAVLGLRAQGYSVLEAPDGFRALELARVTPGIDLLVSDVAMPGLSGPDLVERLREVSPDTRALLMSGHPEAVVLPPDLAARNLPFLPKPFTPERLARKVREVLDGVRPTPDTDSG
jgi:PAS domain S-box-containing protein